MPQLVGQAGHDLPGRQTGAEHDRVGASMELSAPGLTQVAPLDLDAQVGAVLEQVVQAVPSRGHQVSEGARARRQHTGDRRSGLLGDALLGLDGVSFVVRRNADAPASGTHAVLGLGHHLARPDP